MSSLAEVQADTLNKFLEAWRTQDVGTTIELWSDDFKQRLLPDSLGAAVKSRAEAAVIYPVLTSNLSNWKLEIKQIVHDAARGTAAVYATSSADTPLPDEKWATDYAVFISFTEDGTQINKLDEMVDSTFYGRFFPKFQQYLAKTRGTPAH
ncbi:hypothetical protein PG993_005600 [Apiospora rasikravindrae]|uniref:SnoaL-like domain-containing protein n=1 Tax=Apiospora rasikravindrae TaxID=990691 RepID=A0ABR1THY6_9PEZI